MLRGGHVGLVEDLDRRRASPPSTSAGKPISDLRAAPDFHQLRQLAEGPGGVALAGRQRGAAACRRGAGRGLSLRPRGRRRALADALHVEPRQRLERAARLRAQLRLQRAEVAPHAELAAMLVDHAEVHEQMRRQHVELEVGALHVEAGLRRARSSSSASVSDAVAEALPVRQLLGEAAPPIRAAAPGARAASAAGSSAAPAPCPSACRAPAIRSAPR